MANNENEIDDLHERLAEAEKVRDRVIEFARQAQVKLIAAQTGRQKLFSGYVSERTRIRIDAKGEPRIQILDDDGRVRHHVTNSGECRELNPDEFVAEIKKQFAEQIAAEPAKGNTDLFKAEGFNLTESMKAERARQAAAAKAPLSAEDRDEAARRNPFTREHFNLSRQMLLVKRDPAFAAELERAAGGRMESVGA